MSRSTRKNTHRYDLIHPDAMERLALAMAVGCTRHGETDHIENPMPEGYWLSHAIRHLYRHLAGDTSEDHLGHAMADINIAIATAARPVKRINGDMDKLASQMSPAGWD